MCQCPLGLLPHFYKAIVSPSIGRKECVNALSGCYLISTELKTIPVEFAEFLVSMPSRAVTSFLQKGDLMNKIMNNVVSMPSRAVTSFLLYLLVGAMHSWKQRVNALSGCYLISTLRLEVSLWVEVKMCQCPLGLLPHFYRVRS